MKKILPTILLLISISLQAQVPGWTLHPDYDRIQPLYNGFFVVVKDGKYGMMNDQEKEVIPTKYEGISEFNSGCGLMFANEKFVAYTTDRGEVTDVSNMFYRPVSQNAFSDGYLAVYNTSGYYYLSAKGGAVLGPFTFASTFNEGYAWVKVPKSTKHVLDGASIFQVLSAQTGEKISLNLGEYDEEDIDFISSVSNGKSIIVLKKRFFEYDFKKEVLTPLATDGNIENKKSRVIALERPVQVNIDGESYAVQFKQGKMTFDPLMRLTSITYTGQPTKTVEVPQPVPVEYKSALEPIPYAGTQLQGLKFNDKEVLPAQFDEVVRLFDNSAVVKQNGKYGVVTIDPQHNCRFMLNEDLAIGFEHKNVKTNVKVVCPPYFKLSLMTLSSQDASCKIYSDTRRETSNIEAAVLSYDCTLDIPDEIGMEPTPSSVKFALNYDGLRFTPATISFETWYINNYDVTLLSHQITGSALKTEIMVRNNSRGSTNYPRKIEIETSDSTQCSYTKVNEELYSAHFYDWKNNTVRFSVNITEDGCPQISYPISIPVKSTKEKDKPNEPETEKVVQEQAKIVKKYKPRPKPQPKEEDTPIILK